MLKFNKIYKDIVAKYLRYIDIFADFKQKVILHITLHFYIAEAPYNNLCMTEILSIAATY